MPWSNATADIKGITYNVGQKIEGLNGTCYTNVTGSSSGYTFEQLVSMYGYTYYYGGIWQAPGGGAVAAPYGIRTVSGGDILFSANADNFPAALYTIRYDSNGGSDMSAWTQTKRWGEDMSLTNTVPTRAGHTFTNWQDRAPGQTGATGYAPGAVYNRNESVTMYAMWRINTYTVSYNANGGSGAPGNQTKTYGQTLVLSSTKPTRSGYIFMGWATSSGGSAAYYAGGNYTSDASITLYAVWLIINYTVTYNANGGNGAPGPQIKTHGQTITLSSTAPTRAGYMFQGWSTSSGGGVIYRPGGSYSADASVTLYAVWQINTWAVSYNANGGSGAPGGQTKVYGQTLTLSSARPTRTGHTFLRWNTAANGSGTDYNPGGGYNVNATVTLYAQWQINTWTVSYNAYGGSGAPGSQTKTYGQTLILSNARPTRTGYTFKGWATSAGGGVVYQAGGSYTSNAGATLYAVWDIIVLTVTLNASANGGSVPETSRRINHGDRIGNLPVAQRQYYKFMGWFTAVSGGSQIGPEQVITSDITCYAQYKIDASFFMYDGTRWVPMIVFEYHDGHWCKVFAFEYHNGQWRQGIGG